MKWLYNKIRNIEQKFKIQKNKLIQKIIEMTNK